MCTRKCYSKMTLIQRDVYRSSRRNEGKRMVQLSSLYEHYSTRQVHWFICPALACITSPKHGIRTLAKITRSLRGRGSVWSGTVRLYVQVQLRYTVAFDSSQLECSKRQIRRELGLSRVCKDQGLMTKSILEIRKAYEGRTVLPSCR